MEIRVDNLKVTLILQKRRYLLILIIKSVLKSTGNLPRNGKNITISFFSAVSVTGYSVRNFLVQLSISFIGNSLFLDIYFKWHTSEWNLKKSETIENVRNSKLKIKPTLYS